MDQLRYVSNCTLSKEKITHNVKELLNIPNKSWQDILGGFANLADWYGYLKFATKPIGFRRANLIYQRKWYYCVMTMQYHWLRGNFWIEKKSLKNNDWGCEVLITLICSLKLPNLPPFSLELSRSQATGPQFRRKNFSNSKIKNLDSWYLITSETERNWLVRTTLTEIQ